MVEEERRLLRPSPIGLVAEVGSCCNVLLEMAEVEELLDFPGQFLVEVLTTSWS